QPRISPYDRDHPIALFEGASAIVLPELKLQNAQVAVVLVLEDERAKPSRNIESTHRRPDQDGAGGLLHEEIGQRRPIGFHYGFRCAQYWRGPRPPTRSMPETPATVCSS